MPILWDVPIDDYHASRHASSSKLGDFDSRGPRYYAARYVTRAVPGREPSDALLFGQAFEDLLQRLPDFETKYAIKPAGMKFSTVDGKAWRNVQTKPILSEADVEAMRVMADAVWDNEAARTLIAHAQQQPTIRCDYDGTPGLQSRPDWLSTTGCALSGFAPYSLDVKTVCDLGRMTSGRAVREHSYHVQGGICREACAREGLLGLRCFLLACEKQEPHRAQVVELPRAWLDRGWRWADARMQELARCYREDSWPRVESEMIELAPPPAWMSDSGFEAESTEDEKPWQTD